MLLLKSGNPAGPRRQPRGRPDQRRFPQRPRRHAGESIAAAKNNMAVELHVPPGYRLNMPRFLRRRPLHSVAGISPTNPAPKTATPAATVKSWPKTCSLRREP